MQQAPHSQPLGRRCLWHTTLLTEDSGKSDRIAPLFPGSFLHRRHRERHHAPGSRGVPSPINGAQGRHAQGGPPAFPCAPHAPSSPPYLCCICQGGVFSQYKEGSNPCLSSLVNFWLFCLIVYVSLAFSLLSLSGNLLRVFLQALN